MTTPPTHELLFAHPHSPFEPTELVRLLGCVRIFAQPSALPGNSQWHPGRSLLRLLEPWYDVYRVVSSPVPRCTGWTATCRLSACLSKLLLFWFPCGCLKCFHCPSVSASALKSLILSCFQRSYYSLHIELAAAVLVKMPTRDTVAEEARRQPSNGVGLSASGLPRARSQKKSSGDLALRHYASFSDIKASAGSTLKTSPAQTSGSLRVAGGPVPLQPFVGPSPFRFLTEDEDLPLTPMDVSPITPRTPRFVISTHTPSLAPSDPASPQDFRSAEHHLNSKVSSLEKSDFLMQDHQDEDRQPRLASSLAPTRSHSRTPSGRSNPHVATYETPLEEEEYVKYISAEYARLALSRSKSPSVSAKSRAGQHSGQQSRGRAVAAPTDTRRLSTRSLSPPCNRHRQHVERPFATAAVVDPLQHIDGTGHRRKASTASKTSQPSQRHDFAAAKEALDQERSGASKTQWATYAKKTRNASIDETYPVPRPIAAPTVVSAVVTQPKVTPTPVKPVLSRLGSRLKSEVKGAFARKMEPQVEEASRLIYVQEVITKVEPTHWTELDY